VIEEREEREEELDLALKLQLQTLQKIEKRLLPSDDVLHLAMPMAAIFSFLFRVAVLVLRLFQLRSSLSPANGTLALACLLSSVLDRGGAWQRVLAAGLGDRLRAGAGGRVPRRRGGCPSNNISFRSFYDLSFLWRLPCFLYVVDLFRSEGNGWRGLGQ